MGSFGRALAGGIAGAARATGEVFDDRMKESVDARKQAILAKREETIAKIQHDYRMAEGKDQQIYSDKVRGEQNTRADIIRKEDRINSQLDNITGDIRATNKSDAKFEQEKKLRQMQIEGNKDVAKIRSSGIAKPAKTADKNYALKQAAADVMAKLNPYNPMMINDGKGVLIDLKGKSTNEIKKIKTDLSSFMKSKGFPSADISVDGEALFISPGGFNHKKYRAGLDNPDSIKEEKIIKEEKTTKELTPEENLLQLQSILNKHKKSTSLEALDAPGSNLNNLQMMPSHKSSLARPATSGLATPNIDSNIDWNSRLAPIRDISSSIKKNLQPIGNRMTDFVNRQQGFK